jgi:hypothetical protein
VTGAIAKNGPEHPFLKKDPKPTRHRLMGLLDPLGRKRYAEVERFLATVNGATSGLHHFGPPWGWAVRYLHGKNTLCVLHLLPRVFEVTVTLGKDLDEVIKTATLPNDLKRHINRSKAQNGTRDVRLPLKSDQDFGSFTALIKLKSEASKSKKSGTVKAQPGAKAASGTHKPGGKGEEKEMAAPAKKPAAKKAAAKKPVAKKAAVAKKPVAKKAAAAKKPVAKKAAAAAKKPAAKKPAAKKPAAKKPAAKKAAPAPAPAAAPAGNA